MELIHKEAAALRAVDYKVRSPEAEAQIHHLTMVQAYGLCRLPHVIPEFKVFYAGFGAGHVTQDVEMVAHDKGRLAELSQKMEEFRKREGLSADEFWYRGGGPNDYESLEEEYGQISGRIADTVFVHTLKRYRIIELADLYESDPREFEIQREIGRRILFPPKDEHCEIAELMDSNIRDNYGSDALARIQKRVAELRASNA